MTVLDVYSVLDAQKKACYVSSCEVTPMASRCATFSGHVQGSGPVCTK